MDAWENKTLRIDLPDGAALGPAQFHDGKMIQQIDMADGSISLAVIDLEHGRVYGTIELVPEALR